VDKRGQKQDAKTFSHYSLGKKQFTEKEIVERAQEDPSFFGVLYDIYFDRIYAYILRRVSNIETAEDLTSVTFEKALRGLEGFKWKEISFSSWLYKIASNNVADYFRKSYREKNVDIEKIPELKDEKEDVGVNISKKMFFKKIQEGLLMLTDNDQKLVSLKFFEEKSNEEIAEIVGLQKQHVAVQMHRALKKLRDSLSRRKIEY